MSLGFWGFGVLGFPMSRFWLISFKVIILASDLSILVTLPEYWPLICLYYSRDMTIGLILVNNLTILCFQGFLYDGDKWVETPAMPHFPEAV